MTTTQPLSLFISSKMAELAEERQAVQRALTPYNMHGWLFEKDAGARPESIQQTYLEEVASCDIYLGLFWQGYGQYTIEEFEKARALHKPCLVYEKHVEIEQRDPQLTTFLRRIQQVTDPRGVTVRRFQTAGELAEQVSQDVLHLLITDFRKSRKQPPVWNVPYQRNPFFTGREEVFKRIHNAFSSTRTAPTKTQVLNGLGGIGKTQIALEYAFRYRSEYSAVIWVRADSPKVFASDFVSIAYLLDLPEKKEQDQYLIINAVKSWLNTHTQWLLIFDNADEFEIMKRYLPTGGNGHILVTTILDSTSEISSRPILIEKIPLEEGILFLLHRANIISEETPLETASREDYALAQKIVEIMDGHPLALDQAGAFIKETQYSLSDYLQFYKKRQTELLERRGGRDESTFGHDKPIATTWSLSFQQVTRANPAAADLLKFFAFLHPDAIPEEIITESASDLGPLLKPVATDPLKLNDAIGELLKYSLMSRNSDVKTLTIHRLVQAVLKDNMNENTQLRWILRAVHAINNVFQDPEFTRWQRYQLYLPHAYACLAMIDEWEIISEEAVQLLRRTGFYLQDSILYDEAEPFLKQVLQTLYERSPMPEPLEIATSLNSLASLYRDQGKYAEAEPLLQRALAISEKVLGPEHPDVATSLNNLAVLYDAQGKYAESEPLFLRALAIQEKVLGPEHPDVATSLNNLAILYQDQGKYAEAEPLLQRALAIREKALEPEHPDVAQSLDNLASLYLDQGKYAEAEPLYQRDLAIREKVLGPEHPDVATSLHNLASLYDAQGKYAEAEPLYQRALAISEKVLGPEHPDVATSLNNLASLYHAQGKYAEAEPLYQRALAIREKVLGPEHPHVAKSLNRLANLYREQGKYAEVEPLLLRALAIQEKVLGPEHPDVATSLNDLASLYRDQGKYAEAEPLLLRALAIREKVLGPEHADAATSLNNLVELYQAQDKFDQIEILYKKELNIRETTLGLKHPEVIKILNELAYFYYDQSLYEKAEPLYRRALEICQQTFGANHASVASCMNNLAATYDAEEKYAEAEPLYRASLSIRENILGPDHQDVAEILDNYAGLLNQTKRKKEAAKLVLRAQAIRAKHEKEQTTDV